VKSAPEHAPAPGDLLRDSASWVASAVAQNLADPLAALRADVQAARRLLGRECPDSPVLAATLAKVLGDADRLEGVVAALRDPAGARTASCRLSPEREVAAAVMLATGSGHSAKPAEAGRAPRVTGRPGLIGAAVLHLLLCLPAVPDPSLKVWRPDPSSLVVQLTDAALAPATTSLHAAAAAAAVARLGGVLDLDAAGGPRLEIPLEL
jgi:hypothetical protein